MLKNSLTIDQFSRHRNLSRSFSLFPVAVGFLTLLGWGLDVEWLKHPLPHSSSMNPVNAVCFILCGIALFFFSYQYKFKEFSFIVRILILLPFLVGTIRSLELFFNLPFQIDTYLFRNEFLPEVQSGIDRMSIHSGFNFMLFGVAFALIGNNTVRSKWLGNIVLLIIGFVSIFAVIIYAYQVEEFYLTMKYFPMAVQSAVCFLGLALALILLNTDGGFMRIVNSSFAGGIMARYLVPTTILIPIVLGYIRLYFSWEYNMTPELGVSVLVSSIIIVFLILVVSMASQLNEKDKLRASAEEQIRNLNVELQKKIEEKTAQLTNVFEGIPDGFIALDTKFNYVYANKRVGEMVGHNALSLIGKNVWELFPEAVGSDTYKAFVYALENHKYVRNVDYYEPLDLWQENHIYPSLDGLFVFITDISERKRAERHQALLVSIIESADEAIISKNINGVITSWNRGAEMLFGYSVLEAVGKPITILIPPDRLYEEATIIEKVKRGQFVNHYETMRLRKDGTLLEVSITVSPIRDANGKIVGASKMARDISERKKAEFEIEKLNISIKQNEQRLKALVENSDDIISLYDKQYHPIYRSPNFARITGWPMDEVEKINAVNLIHPDDQLYMRNILQEILNNPGMAISSRYRFKHKAGHYIWMEAIGKNLLHDPAIQGVVTNIRDVSHRLETEDKLVRSEKIYRTIASSIPGSVISIIDTDHRYLLVEGDMLDKFGYQKEKMVGYKIADVVQDEQFALFLPELLRAFQGETFSVEMSRLGFDMVTRYVPLKDEDSNVYAIMTVGIDVTELKNAQRDINILNVDLEKKVVERTAQLAAVNKELEAFSYSVSHDLRAPLRAINGYSNMLEEDYQAAFDENGKRILNIIKANGIRMSILIEDLLAFSRLGRKDVQKYIVNMDDLVKGVLTEINKNSSHHAEIIVNKLPDVLADASLVKQVLINFISNAIKYSSKKDKPRIEIKSFIKHSEQVFAVHDNGAGFDMKYSHKLFGVFQRLHGTEEFEGNGVGLAVVKRIVSKHGGQVWAEGEVGKGATFYFSLPEQSNDLTNNVTLDYKYDGTNGS